MNAPAPLEIVGGGLAGLSLGLALRRAAVPVTIHEAGDYPRHRVCGEFITGLGEATVARLGLAPLLRDAVQHRDMVWFVREKLLASRRLPAPALGLSRYALDARLADAFVAAGGELRRHTRIAPTAQPGRILAQGRQRGGSTWLGLKFHARGLALASHLEFHLGNRAYVGLSPVEDGSVNVCGLFRRRALSAPGPRLLLDYLRAAGLAPLAARLARATIDPATFCAVAALRFGRVSRIVSTSTISLGDACAMIPPFTGNGMAMAFQSAELALDPLLAFARGETDWSATCRTVNAALRSRFRLRLASARALHPFLLHPLPQRGFAALQRAGLLPFRRIYDALH